MSCSKPSPYFFLPVILVQVDLNISCRKNAFSEVVFLTNSNLVLFAPCSEPSVFALVKSSLDCRLWQWHTCLLETVLILAGCCERVFLYHGEDPPIIHHWCPLWMSRPFYVAELTSAFFFFSECTRLLIWPLLIFLLSLWWICFVFEANNRLFHLYGQILWLHDVVHSNSFQMQMAHLESTPDLLSA